MARRSGRAKEILNNYFSEAEHEDDDMNKKVREAVVHPLDVCRVLEGAHKLMERMIDDKDKEIVTPGEEDKKIMKESAHNLKAVCDQLHKMSEKFMKSKMRK